MSPLGRLIGVVSGSKISGSVCGMHIQTLPGIGVELIFAISATSTEWAA